MITWLAGKIGAPIWLMEIVLAAVAGGVIFWYIKHREAVAYDQGHESGIKENIEDRLKPLKKELEDKQAAVAVDRQLVDKDKSNVAAEKRNLIQLRSGMEQEYSRQLKMIQSREAESDASIDMLSDAEVVSALRLQLIRNRAIIEASADTNK